MDSLSKDRSPTKSQKAGELWRALLTQWFHYPSLRVICRGKLFNDYKEILFSSQGNVLHKSYMDFCQVEMLLKTIYLLTRYFFFFKYQRAAVMKFNLIMKCLTKTKTWGKQRSDPDTWARKKNDDTDSGDSSVLTQKQMRRETQTLKVKRRLNQRG